MHLRLLGDVGTLLEEKTGVEQRKQVSSPEDAEFVQLLREQAEKEAAEWKAEQEHIQSSNMPRQLDESVTVREGSKLNGENHTAKVALDNIHLEIIEDVRNEMRLHDLEDEDILSFSVLNG